MLDAVTGTIDAIPLPNTLELSKVDESTRASRWDICGAQHRGVYVPFVRHYGNHARG